MFLCLRGAGREWGGVISAYLSGLMVQRQRLWLGRWRMCVCFLFVCLSSIGWRAAAVARCFDGSRLLKGRRIAGGGVVVPDSVTRHSCHVGISWAPICVSNLPRTSFFFFKLWPTVNTLRVYTQQLSPLPAPFSSCPSHAFKKITHLLVCLARPSPPFGAGEEQA